MDDLLLLAHRIPYPPNKGDKIRSFNLLKYLSRHYRIHLGAFVDDPRDWRHAEAVRKYCADAFLTEVDRPAALLRSLGGLMTGQALTPCYYADGGMRRWVAGTLDQVGMERILAFSGAMAAFVGPEVAPDARRVVDFVDVDSDKWAQYGARRGGPGGWLYRREARRLLDYERRIAATSAASVFVSRAEAELFTRLAPETGERVRWVENGVDTNYFSPVRPFANPYPEGTTSLVLTGAMDYWANVDAAEWFAREVFPRIRARRPEACFYVVGARPAEAVRRLREVKGVHVTGAVTDIRPYLAHARLAVAPMRVARGIQNKVLEAMAMARPVLATGKALEGLDLPASCRLRADSEEALAAEALAALADDGGKGERSREWVHGRYAWERHMDRLVSLLEGTPEARPLRVQPGGPAEELPRVVG